MELKIKKLSEAATIPTKAHETDACFDLYANISSPVVIKPGEAASIGTGIATEIPFGYYCAVYARSGMGIKRHLRPSNCVGIIDEDYRGEWIVSLINDGSVEQTINPNDRIAQFCLLPVITCDIKEVSELTDTVRGVGGFGSSGN